MKQRYFYWTKWIFKLIIEMVHFSFIFLVSFKNLVDKFNYDSELGKSLHAYWALNRQDIGNGIADAYNGIADADDGYRYRQWYCITPLVYIHSDTANENTFIISADVVWVQM